MIKQIKLITPRRKKDEVIMFTVGLCTVEGFNLNLFKICLFENVYCSTVEGFNLNLLVWKCVLCTVQGFNLNLLVWKYVLCTVEGFNLYLLVWKCVLCTVEEYWMILIWKDERLFFTETFSDSVLAIFHQVKLKNVPGVKLKNVPDKNHFSSFFTPETFKAY